MMLSLFSYVVGIFKLILIPVLLVRKGKESYLNIYFLIILGISGTVSLLTSLNALGIFSNLERLVPSILPIAAIFPPLNYLFFEALLFKIPSKKENLKLFGIAGIYIAITLLVSFSARTVQILFSLYSTGFLILLIRLLARYFKTSKNSANPNKSLKVWLILMIILTLLQYLFANYLSNLNLSVSHIEILSTYHQFSAILWFSIIVYLLLNPGVLYGEKHLLAVLNAKDREGIKIWSEKPIQPIESADQEMFDKLNIEKILFILKSFEKNNIEDFKEIETLKTLSELLNYPQKHLRLIFKYFSKYTFKEYQNILKINYSISLLKSGYLNKFTLEDLSKKCYYSSRITFHNNFKKFTGSTPGNYFGEKT